MKRYISYVWIPALLAVAGMLASAAKPHLKYDARYRQSEIEAAKESIALTLMGQLQTSMFDLMWLKTLEYLHHGVVYRMPTAAEEEKGKVATDSVGTAHGLEHKEGESLVPHREEDWRGLIGDIHRSVTPYSTVHSHSDPKELIPWYKFATKISPSQVRLYTMGAFFMSDFAHEPDEAIELLEVGLESNPWSFEVNGALGRLLFDYKQDYAKAAEVLAVAVEYGEKERDYYLARDEQFDDYQKQVYSESYLFLAKSLTELGEYDKALAVCDEGYERTNHTHLNVQKRITTRRKEGVSVNDEGKDPGNNMVGLLELIRAIENKRPIERILGYFRINPDVGHMIDPSSKTTALHAAARAGYLECVEKLLEFGTDVNMRDGNGDTALKISLEFGQKEVAQLLESRGGIVLKGNEVLEHDNHGAAGSSDGKDAVPAPAPAPASVPAAQLQSSLEGEITDFMRGISQHDPIRQLERLLEKSQWPKAVDENGATALHYAAAAGYGELVRELVKMGVALDAKDQSGKTALDMARESGHEDIAAILGQTGSLAQSSQ